MKRNRMRTISKHVTLMVALISTAGSLSAAEPQKRPNIVLFCSDDHGYRHSGVYGDPNVRTPNVDRLASEGMRFTHAFAGSPLCSPARSVLHTGLLPFRNGGHKFSTPIKAGIKTTPEYFREMGYYTIHVGKFHHSGPDKKTQFKYDQVERRDSKAAEVIQSCPDKKPLLIVVCSYDPHTPWKSNSTYEPDQLRLPPHFVDTPESRKALADYYTDVTAMDALLGQVLSALEKRNMVQNTLFVYTTDQGGQLPFGKWNLYDDGIRVPFIARWPGRIEANTVCDAMISHVDWLPTCIEAAGSTPPADIDGKSILDVLFGKRKEHREMIFAAHTGNDNGGPNCRNFCPARAVRTRKHKYILNLEPERKFQTHTTGKDREANPHDYWGSWERKAETDEPARKLVNAHYHRPQEELYDLEKDPFEMNNLIKSPEYESFLSELRLEMNKWRKQQGDDVPMNTGPYVKP